MDFRIAGLEPGLFAPLAALDDAALAARGARRVRVEAEHAAPCRVSLDDARPGESVLLASFEHQPALTPYRQQGPIFVRAGAARFEALNTMPPALARRTLSLRGYDGAHMMIAADLVEGAAAPALIRHFFADPALAYIHAHYARRGCFAALIERA